MIFADKASQGLHMLSLSHVVIIIAISIYRDMVDLTRGAGCLGGYRYTCMPMPMMMMVVVIYIAKLLLLDTGQHPKCLYIYI